MTESSVVSEVVGESDERPKRVGKLIASLGVGNLSIFLIWGAISGILLPTQLQSIDADNKVSNLAIVGAMGAVVSILAQPFWGRISDRARSRFGKRSPFIVFGLFGTGLSLIGMGSSNSVVMLTIAYGLVNVFLNMSQATITAVIPDRVPIRLRGTVSTVVGIGLMAGNVGGQIVGSNFASDPLRGYLVLSGFLIVVGIAFVLLNPDKSSKDAPREPFSWSEFAQTFWVNPARYPDFAWTFIARILLLLGFFGVSLYQLYILSDYIGLGDGAAAQVPVLGLITLATTILSMVVCGPLSDRLQRRKVFVFVASIILGIGLVMPFFIPTMTGMMLYAGIAGLGFGCYLAVDAAIVTLVLPKADDAGKDLGIANIAAALPQVLAPVVAGTAVAVTGGYQPLFIVALILAVLGALAILPIKSIR